MTRARHIWQISRLESVNKYDYQRYFSTISNDSCDSQALRSCIWNLYRKEINLFDLSLKDVYTTLLTSLPNIRRCVLAGKQLSSWPLNTSWCQSMNWKSTDALSFLYMHPLGPENMQLTPYSRLVQTFSMKEERADAVYIYFFPAMLIIFISAWNTKENILLYLAYTL